MSGHLLLTRNNDIKLLDYDPEIGKEYRYYNKNKHKGIFEVMNKATKEIQSFTSEKARNDFFYKEKEIDSLLVHLRSPLQLEEGVTLGNLQEAIAKHEDLAAFLSIICPMYPQMNVAADGEEVAKEMIICSKVQIEKGTFDVDYNLGFTNSRNWGPETLLTYDEICPIEDDEDLKLDPINAFYSLQDVLMAIWGHFTPMPVALMKDGVYDESGIKVEEPVEVLNRPCALAEDVTLGDIFNMLDQHEMLKDFISMYSWCGQIDAFHEAAKQQPSPDKDEKLWFLEIHRHQSIYKNGRRKHQNYLEYTPELHAIGELSESEKEHYKAHPESEPRDFTTYGIGMSPMADLKHLTFKLADLDFIVHNNNYNVEYRKSYKTYYTLLEILDAIYWEISFYGGPEESEEFKQELARRVESVKDGTAKTYSWEEIEKKFDEDDEE